MSWPSTADFSAPNRRVRKPKWEPSEDEQRERFLAENKPAPDPPPDPKLTAILEFMRGDGFGAWYEATTGGDANKWLDGILECGRILQYRNTLELIRQSVLDLIRANRWTNPEARALWAVDISSKRPTERRRILLRLATPRWANIETIAEVYLERARLTRETGIEHDVDHIVPIVNARVCGLHCEHNLRVVTAHENRTKSNRFDG